MNRLMQMKFKVIPSVNPSKLSKLVKRLKNWKDAMKPFNNKHRHNSIRFFDERDARATSLLDDFQCSTIDQNQSKHCEMNGRNHNEINRIIRSMVTNSCYSFWFQILSPFAISWRHSRCDLNCENHSCEFQKTNFPRYDPPPWK
jgi:hypothetical protein